ncbi:carboxymuconolactone decarboxylase family protein [Saccharothrix syringae]|uniref:Carboxymuconolactone decarboxylase family protein n=1 Tax=Saccharothrix syringae TaxID=103733 RepID=A0A5Q0H8Q3_SACSY|nr:carboxymuconolactone decarboxylase family protein [Saccharothrix syringae]QFZ22220.1 carboxymuconolactone decarboxylase family protein [Saccharothrix syringae]
MSHIDLGNDLPGIAGLTAYRPETGRPISELVEVLLRGPGGLPRGERELIAAHVSELNSCTFCASSHAAFAAAQLPADHVRSPKLDALLAIAAAVVESGRAVTPELVAKARENGATEAEVHDTVLIAAVFCMLNRYVDGLGTWAPDDPAAYAAMADRIVNHGYTAPR